MSAFRWAVVIFVALVLQAALVADLELFDARGDIMLLLPLAAGVAGGAERGALVGFAAGLAFDLLLSTPFGLSALAYCITGYVVGALQGGVLRTAWWIPVASAAGGSVLGVFTFALTGSVVGEDNLFGGHLIAVVLVVTILNGLLITPTTRVARWAWAESGGPVSAPRPRLARR